MGSLILVQREECDFFCSFEVSKKKTLKIIENFN